MGFFVWVGLLIVLGAIGFIGGRTYAAAGKRNGERNSGTLIAFSSIGVGLLAVLLLTVFSSFHTVNNGEIGIVKQFGNLVGTTGSGLVTTAPWQSLAEVSVRNELRNYDMGQTNSAVSADSQPVYLDVQVNYSVERGKAVSLFQSTGGDFVNRLLDPAVYQYTKEVTAEYKATDFAANREQIRRAIESRLDENLKGEGIQINSVTLKNVSFTPALSQAIERTVEANQNAKQAEAQVRVVQAEAQQKVAQANGAAEATLVQARADAEAQRLKQRTLTPLLVQEEAIKAINPNVKVIVCQQGQACVPQAVVSTANAG